MRPPFPYYGGKMSISSAIADLLPGHRHYVEPFAGSLSVLLAKPASRLETVNDLHRELVTFWKVLRDDPVELARVCALTPHSRAEYEVSAELTGDDLEIARRVWARLTQSRSALLGKKTGWRYYVDPGGTSASMPDYLTGYVQRFAAVADRLHRVSLECRPALDIITTYGAVPEACLYVDPPYLGSTRNGAHYAHEMASQEQHLELLDSLLCCRAAVVLSGYASEFYDTTLTNWHRIEIASFNGNATDRQRTEIVWSNREIGPPTLDLDLDNLTGATP